MHRSGSRDQALHLSICLSAMALDADRLERVVSFVEWAPLSEAPGEEKCSVRTNVRP